MTTRAGSPGFNVCFSAVAHVLFAGGFTQRSVVESHTVLAQSELILHFNPVAQGGHIPPPQSTSVSLLSLTPSVHDAGAQTPLAQTGAAALVQSALVKHCTQFPMPSHFTAFPTAHAMPMGASMVPQTQFEHVVVRQGLALSGQSEAFMHAQLPEELDVLLVVLLLAVVPPVPPFPEPVELALDEVESVVWPPVLLLLVVLPPPPHPLPAQVASGNASARPANQNLDECKTTSSMGTSHGTPRAYHAAHALVPGEHF
jgi:hypothetical protein